MDIKDLSKELQERINIYNEKLKTLVLDDLNKETDKAKEKSYREFGVYQKAEIRRLFNEAVKKWYDSYEPKIYHREYGLYKVLDFSTSEDKYGMVSTRSQMYDELYNSSLMPTGRNGYDLFEKVFIEGWHGGAESIAQEKEEQWGVHPNPGVPYYRTPHPKYNMWGNEAEQTESVYSIAAELISVAEKTTLHDKLDEIAHKNNDEAVEIINGRIKNGVYQSRVQF